MILKIFSSSSKTTSRLFTSADNIAWAEVLVENATWEVFINICYTV
jgi:hypothetical protein